MMQRIPGTAVLVVEDNAVSREVIAHQLRMLGCEPVCAEDGDEGASAWRGGNFAMLLTDLQMPKVDGFELAALVRRAESGCRVPIVALTASDDPSELALCQASGMDDCLSKPISLARLGALLDHWLGAVSVRPGS